MRPLLLFCLLAGMTMLLAAVPVRGDDLFPVELTKVERISTTGDSRLVVDIRGVGLDRRTRFSLVRAFGNSDLVKSRLRLFSTVEDMALDGHLLYLANNRDGLVAVDIARPERPEVLGSLSLPGRAMRVLVRGDVALVLTVRQGLHLVDISDPSAMQLLKTYPLEDVAYDMAANDRYLYISSPRRGIWVFHLRQRDVESAGTGRIQVESWELELEGDTLAVVHGRKGLGLYRGAASGRPEPVHMVALPDFCRHVSSLGDGRFAVRGQRDLFVVNAVGSGEPDVDTYRNMAAGGGGMVRRGDILYWGAYKGLFVASIASTGELLAPGMAVVPSGVRTFLPDRHFLWVADQQQGLLALDLRAELSMADRSLFHLGGRAMDMAVAQGWIYATGNSFDLQVMQMGRRGRLLPVGRTVERLAVVSAATNGPVLCLGSADRELLLVDVAPKPEVRSRVVLPGRPNDLVMDGNSLFVAAGEAGVLHYRLTGTGQATQVGVLPFTSEVVGLAAQNGKLVAIAANGDVFGIGVGAEGRLRKTWSRTAGLPAVDVLLLEDQLFLVRGDGRVVTWRLGFDGAPDGDPLRLQLMGPAVQLAGDRGRLFVRLRNGALYRYLLRRRAKFLVPQAPELISHHVSSIRLQPRGLVVVQTSGRILVLDPGAGGTVRTLAELGSPNAGREALLVKDFLLTYDGRRFVAFWPLSSKNRAVASFGGQGKALAVKDHLIAVANLSQLRLVDVNIPDAPKELARLPLPGVVHDVCWQGRTVACFVRDYGVVLIDASVPTVPVVLGRVPMKGLALVTPVGSDRLLVVSSGRGRFRLVDISVPDSPVLLDELSLTPPADEISRPADVLVHGDIAYVADHTLGLLVLRIFADGRLKLVGSRGTGGSPFALALGGSRLYLSNWDLGIMEFDVSAPARPVLTAIVPGTEGCRHLYVVDKYLIVHDDKLRAVYSQPLPLSGRVQARGDALRVEFQTPEAPGNYLLFAADERSWDRLPLIRVERDGQIRQLD